MEGCTDGSTRHVHVGELLYDPGPPVGLTAAPTPTPAPEPTPVPAAEPVVETAPAVATPAVEAFLQGYRAGGGDPVWEAHWVNDVIPCESEWTLDPAGFHLGLAQFAPGTWGQARCSPEADYRSPWEQGCAVARWMSQTPGRWGTTSGWPRCWWR